MRSSSNILYKIILRNDTSIELLILLEITVHGIRNIIPHEVMSRGGYQSRIKVIDI